LEVPCWLVSIDEREVLLLEHCANVLELVLDGASRSSWQEFLKGSIDLGFDWSLAPNFPIEHREVRSDEGIDLPPPPRLACLWLVEFQFNLFVRMACTPG
jgi:hypothetical protein